MYYLNNLCVHLNVWENVKYGSLFAVLHGSLFAVLCLLYFQCKIKVLLLFIKVLLLFICLLISLKLLHKFLQSMLVFNFFYEMWSNGMTVNVHVYMYYIAITSGNIIRQWDDLLPRIPRQLSLHERFDRFTRYFFSSGYPFNNPELAKILWLSLGQPRGYFATNLGSSDSVLI